MDTDNVAADVLDDDDAVDALLRRCLEDDEATASFVGRTTTPTTRGRDLVRVARRLTEIVREACAVFLVADSAAPTTTTTTTTTAAASYESSFPSLRGDGVDASPSTPTTTTTTPKSAWSDDGRRRRRRRIRPVPASPSSRDRGNISSLPSQDTSAMMRRRVVPSSVVVSISTDTAAVAPRTPTTTVVEAGVSSMSLRTPSESEHAATTTPSFRTTPAPTTPPPPPPPPPPSSPPLSKLERNARLSRLVRLRVAVVERLLVPSTLGEVRWLLRLASLSDDARPTARRRPAARLSRVLTTGADCRSYAVGVLSRLSALDRLDVATTRALSVCPPLRRGLPERTARWEAAAASARARRPVASLTTTDDDDDDAVDLSRPFVASRDSRHRHRSASRAAAYANREECRDRLLGALRAFRRPGTVDARRRADEARAAARRLVHRAVAPSNDAWFAGLFCDAHAATCAHRDDDEDDEDERRLRRLRRRLTTKSATTTTVGDDGDRAVSLEDLFPGPQEFFHHFLRAVDSHRFHQRLRRRLVAEMVEDPRSPDDARLGRWLTRQRARARLLGLSAFGHRWDDDNDDDDDDVDERRDARGAELSFDDPLPVRELVAEARRRRCAIAVVPWVVEYLRTTDRRSRSRRYYRRTLASLRRTQREAAATTTDDDVAAETRGVLVFSLEPLFADEPAGLEATEDAAEEFPERDEDDEGRRHPLVRRMLEDATDLDLEPLSFDKGRFRALCPGLEELRQLVARVATNESSFAGRVDGGGGGNAEVATPRKIRPVGVSPATVTTHHNFANVADHRDDAPRRSASAVPPPPPPSPLPAAELLADDDAERVARARLDNAFLRKHRELRVVAELVVDQTLRNVRDRVVDLLDDEDEARAALRRACEEDVAAGVRALGGRFRAELRDAAIATATRRAIEEADRWLATAAAHRARKRPATTTTTTTSRDGWGTGID